MNELVERLQYRMGNPSAWPEGYDEEGSELMREAAARITELEKALMPFAKCSAIYPNAKGKGNTGFAGIHDKRCPVTFEDYHRARAALGE